MTRDELVLLVDKILNIVDKRDLKSPFSGAFSLP